MSLSVRVLAQRCRSAGSKRICLHGRCFPRSENSLASGYPKQIGSPRRLYPGHRTAHTREMNIVTNHKAFQVKSKAECPHTCRSALEVNVQPLMLRGPMLSTAPPPVLPGTTDFALLFPCQQYVKLERD